MRPGMGLSRKDTLQFRRILRFGEKRKERFAIQTEILMILTTIMKALSVLLIYCQVLTLAIALTIPDSFLLSPNISDLVSDFDGITSNQSTNFSAAYAPVCDSHFGIGLKQTSCVNAWQKINRTTTKETFRTRKGVLTEDTPLPVRYLSDDGLCAIDLFDVLELNRGNLEDTTDSLTISEQAGVILAKCAIQKGIGGGIRIKSE